MERGSESGRESVVGGGVRVGGGVTTVHCSVDVHQAPENCTLSIRLEYVVA